ncbi:hypothetical protein K492DRAFT_171813 [Lichtheimia hyalospora FSU 10163]|nr:hypothetical protein K492DRAFT_171813 [Lichtheimia hyalospora FSU 10163]
MPNIDGAILHRTPPRLGIDHSPYDIESLTNTSSSSNNASTRYMNYDSTQETTPIIHQPTPLSPSKHPYSPSDISTHTESAQVSTKSSRSNRDHLSSPLHPHTPQSSRTKKSSKYLPIAVTDDNKKHRDHH